MNRETLVCSRGHELRAIGEGISYCIGGRIFEDTGERWIWLWEVAPSDAKWRFPTTWPDPPIEIRGYRARIFRDAYFPDGGATEEDAKNLAQQAIRELMAVTA